MKQSYKKTSINIVSAVAALAAFVLPGTAYAEMSLSVYGGANFSPHSNVEVNGTGVPALDIDEAVGWDGASFEFPPYYGVRATWWLAEMPQYGIGLDYTHAKVKADLPTGYTTLEFTDGINFLIANGYYRHQMENGWTPYAGVGLGLTIPHVEVEYSGSKTEEYQITGFAAQALVGIDYTIDENWSVFGELKSTYGQVDAELTGGADLETHIISNQVLFGVTYSFK